MFIDESNDDNMSKYTGRLQGSKTIQRKRINILHYIRKMDHVMFRQMYRMKKDAFFCLFELIEQYMPSPGDGGVVPNGPISKEIQLSMAIRTFAGGDKFDISYVHGISVQEVGRSVWFVVDAINSSRLLDISYPSCHKVQASIAIAFREKSTIKIDNCGGAIDGILIWIQKPSKPDVERLGIGPKCFVVVGKRILV